MIARGLGNGDGLADGDGVAEGKEVGMGVKMGVGVAIEVGIGVGMNNGGDGGFSVKLGTPANVEVLLLLVLQPKHSPIKKMTEISFKILIRHALQLRY